PLGSEQPMNGLPGYGTYRTSDDRFVGIGVLVEEHFWSSLCTALGLTEFDGLDLNERIRKKEELDTTVAEAIARMSLSEVQALLEENDVPVAPVLSRSEMLALEHFRHRGTVMIDARPEREGAPVMGHPARYSVHPPREMGPVPNLDEDGSRSWLPR
ncbi:MAG: CoA transferase, partial [Acidimicrobiales bacterium]